MYYTQLSPKWLEPLLKIDECHFITYPNKKPSGDWFKCDETILYKLFVLGSKECGHPNMTLRFACYLSLIGSWSSSFPSSGMAYVRTILWGFDPIETQEHPWGHELVPSGYQPAFKFIPKVFGVVQVWGLCRQVFYFRIQYNVSL